MDHRGPPPLRPENRPRVPFAMDSSSAASRDRIKALYASREAMEHEMASIAQRLSGPGLRGLKGPLVDREGFPIPGVDLYAVRGDRGRYAVLRNDHAAVTDQIQRAMTDLHASAGALRGAASAPARPAESADRAVGSSRDDPSGASAAPPPNAKPFAIIDEVTDGSPAHEAGLVVGDQVIFFAGVDARTGSGDPLPRVAAALAANENRPRVGACAQKRRQDGSIGDPETLGGSRTVGVPHAPKDVTREDVESRHRRLFRVV